MTRFQSTSHSCKPLQQIRPWLRKIIGEGANEAQQSLGELATLGTNWIPSVLSSLWSGSQALISIFSLLVVTPIVTFYLLNDWDGLIEMIDRSVPVAEREIVRTLAREIDDTLAGFLRGQGTICLILALYYASALRLIGLNHGRLIGLAAGLISFIPYLGSLIGLVLSLCVVVLQLGDVRDCRIRLSVRLYRPPYRGVYCRRYWGAGAFCNPGISP